MCGRSPPPQVLRVPGSRPPQRAFLHVADIADTGAGGGGGGLPASFPASPAGSDESDYPAATRLPGAAGGVVGVPPRTPVAPHHHHHSPVRRPGTAGNAPLPSPSAASAPGTAAAARRPGHSAAATPQWRSHHHHDTSFLGGSEDERPLSPWEGLLSQAELLEKALRADRKSVV